MINFHLITLFPEACEPYLSSSIIGRARREKKIKVSYQNPRNFSGNKWGKIDDRPYGGGPGMVMTALPVVKAVSQILTKSGLTKSRNLKSNKRAAVIWFTPGGKQFTNAEADKLKKLEKIVFICGRYEGIDERATKILKTLAPVKKYSIGPYTLTGGEVPALVVIDAITRRLPGVLGKDESVEERRIASREVYTRPETILWKEKKYQVPKILKTGHHAKIDSWRSDR